MKKYKLGIALGGGGARGFAHLGVLACLHEQGIRPEMIAGVSAGSLVGVFLAAGMEPKAVMELMKANKITDYASVTLPINGLLNLQNLRNILKSEIKIENLEDLELPFYVTVSDMLKGKVAYVNQGTIVDYVTASASIPVLFAPVEIQGGVYADGGLFDNLPIEPLMDHCEKIIAVSISPIQEVEQLDNLIEVAARTFQLAVNDHPSLTREQCDLYIEPTGLEQFGILDTSNADALYKIGYDHASQLDLSVITG